jgi:cobalt/nickel transport system permease protein
MSFAGAAVAVSRSRLHDLSGAQKIGASFAWVLLVTLTPQRAFWAFGVHALCVLAVMVHAQLRLRHVVRRLAIETPFVAFALALPLIGRGDRTDVLGMSLSVRGLWAMWSILAKGTLGVAASIVLAATTPVTELLRGLQRLRVPPLIVGICGFMVRYVDVLTDDLRRMRIARLSRGHDPRWLWQARAIAATAGTLFVRAFERGERVHIAMLSRGYDGHVPDFGGGTARPGRGAFAPVAVAAVVVLVARASA